MKGKIFLLLIFFCSFGKIFSQEESSLVKEEILSAENSSEKEILPHDKGGLAAEENIPFVEISAAETNFSVDLAAPPIESVDDTAHVENSAAEKYYSPEEFTFAGNRYYTITGGTALKETNIRPIPALIVAGAYTGIVTALHIAQSNAWWKGKDTSFHFEEDWEFARQIDKCGHSWSGYFVSYWWSHALIESGFSWDAATWTGAALGLLYQTYVEVEDGLADGWGFSPSDEYANLLGASFFVAQHYSPFLQNFIPKWQYIPAKWSGIAARGNGGTWIDDYNSSSYWLGVNVHGLLPQEYKNYWPKWLMLSAGYAVRGIEVQGETPTRYGMLSLDYNLVELLPEGPGFWNWIRQTANHIKLPSPTVEFGPTTKFYLFYPFRISTGNIQF